MERHFQIHKWTNAKLLVCVHDGIAILATLRYKAYFNKILMCNCYNFILMIISLPFTINLINLTIPSFIPWFRILSQYGIGIVLLLGFATAMQYPSKFQMNANIPR